MTTPPGYTITVHQSPVATMAWRATVSTIDPAFAQRIGMPDYQLYVGEAYACTRTTAQAKGRRIANRHARGLPNAITVDGGRIPLLDLRAATP